MGQMDALSGGDQMPPGSMPFYHHFSNRTLGRAQTVDRALVCAQREEQGSILQNGYELRLREEDRRQHQRDRESGSRFQVEIASTSHFWKFSGTFHHKTCAIRRSLTSKTWCFDP